jgi:hypothetical protein
MWMRIVDLARERDAALYRQLTGFPEELPNLARLRPPNNVHPGGLEVSCYARRKRGELPHSY